MGQTIIFFSISETWSFQPWLCDETAVRVSKKVDLNVLSTAQGHLRTTTVHVSKIITCIHPNFHSRGRVLRTQQLRSHLLRTQSWQSSPFKAWSRLEYSYTCFADCQEFLPCLNFCIPGPFTLIIFQILTLLFNCFSFAWRKRSRKRFKQVPPQITHILVSGYILQALTHHGKELGRK